MSQNEGLQKEISDLIKMLETYQVEEDTSNQEDEIIRRYKLIRSGLNVPGVVNFKYDYIALTEKFIETLSKKKNLLYRYRKYMDGYIEKITKNNSENINYFLSFKTYDLTPFYWMIDENKFAGNDMLNHQLDIFKRCFSSETKKLLFEMFQNYYKYQDFKNFSDYSDCIKDTVIIGYITEQQYSESEINKLTLSIGYAGEPGSIGYDFMGIRTIKNVFGLVDKSEVVEAIVTRLSENIVYRKELTAKQINAVIHTSNINSMLKKRLKFTFTTVRIMDNVLKRAVFKSLPNELKIDGDDIEMMNAVSLPTLLTLNDSEYAFTIKDMDSDAETKSVYLIRKGFPKDKLLFSIKDIDDKQFEISYEEEEKIFSYDKAHELSNFFVEILKKEFGHVGTGEVGDIKLIYFWIKEHKILKDKSMTFSDKYKVEYKNKEWVVEDNTNELDSVLYNDHDKVKMINAIVGKNGAGKTTLLDMFKYYFNNQNDENAFKKFLIIYEDGDNLILRHNFEQGDGYKIDVRSAIRYQKMRYDMNSGILSNTSLLSYTSFTELSNYTGSEHDREVEGNHKDLSTNNELRMLERIKDAREREGVKRQLVNEDNYKKLIFLSESETLNEEFAEGIPLPHGVLLKVKVYQNSTKDIEGALTKLFGEKIESSKVLEEYYDISFKLKNVDYKDLSSLYQFVASNSQWICTLDFLGLSSGQYAKLTLFAKLFFESNHKKVTRILGALARANSYVKNYNTKDISSDYLKNNQNENLMILLDEGDMFFHPAWQKSFISDIKSLLNYAFKDHEIVNTVHLLLTSNSPFIMSDIPLEHTIVLGGKYTMEQTYAQNIHDILKSSFFMDNGTLGEVAHKHIKKLIQLFQKEDVTEVERQYIKKSIDMIGEPLIRYKLESMYKKKFSESIKAEQRIKQLEEELELLKKGRGLQ
ncbi:AAA family ATPase [Lysinibacillus sp. FSL K6-3209]|uniref:AAA family ATPase n=1 Tax=Lysinibacillus sp. FSL K6-3209 TaxID=2921497 RepID=UPI0030DD7251